MLTSKIDLDRIREPHDFNYLKPKNIYDRRQLHEKPQIRIRNPMDEVRQNISYDQHEPMPRQVPDSSALEEMRRLEWGEKVDISADKIFSNLIGKIIQVPKRDKNFKLIIDPETGHPKTDNVPFKDILKKGNVMLDRLNYILEQMPDPQNINFNQMDPMAFQEINVMRSQAERRVREGNATDEDIDLLNQVDAMYGVNTNNIKQLFEHNRNREVSVDSLLTNKELDAFVREYFKHDPVLINRYWRMVKEGIKSHPEGTEFPRFQLLPFLNQVITTVDIRNIGPPPEQKEQKEEKKEEPEEWEDEDEDDEDDEDDDDDDDEDFGPIMDEAEEHEAEEKLTELNEQEIREKIDKYKDTDEVYDLFVSEMDNYSNETKIHRPTGTTDVFYDDLFDWIEENYFDDITSLSKAEFKQLIRKWLEEISDLSKVQNTKLASMDVADYKFSHIARKKFRYQFDHEKKIHIKYRSKFFDEFIEYCKDSGLLYDSLDEHGFGIMVGDFMKYKKYLRGT
jgi:hypothetical protein